MSMSLWESCLLRLKEVSSNNDFEMWIRALAGEETASGFVVYAPNPFWAQRIRDNFLDKICIVIEQMSEGRILSHQVQITHGSKPGSVVLDRAEIDMPATTVAALPEEKEDSAKRERSVGFLNHKNQRYKLNPAFTFSLFVEGKSNHMAAEMCRKVLIKLGDAMHNPLVIYGSTGLGKTHLMQAVGNALLQAKPKARVMYVSTEDFMRSYSDCIRRKKMEEFKELYRSLDLLLVDDIHLLRGEGNMTEFFYTLNSLLAESKQVIVTSDRFPKDLNSSLDEKLVSRLSWGLSVEVEPPDIETRVEILLKKAENYPDGKIDLPRNCALFIAQNIVANVRELEGALNKIIAVAIFRNQPIDLDLVKDSLKDVVAIRARSISVDNIQKVVSEFYGVSVKELTGNRRLRKYARPRQIAMSLTRLLTKDSYPEIGAAFGGRDHSTVMHACEQVDKLRQEDTAVDDDYKTLLKFLQC